MEKFIVALTAVAEIYGVKISEERLIGYCSVLDDFESKQLVHALQIHVRQSKWFPLPADLIEIITGTGGDIEGQALVVWAKLSGLFSSHRTRNYSAFMDMYNSDSRIETAIDACGGWYALKDGREEFKWARKTFVKAFVGASQAERKQHNMKLIPTGNVKELISKTTKKLSEKNDS